MYTEATMVMSDSDNSEEWSNHNWRRKIPIGIGLRDRKNRTDGVMDKRQDANDNNDNREDGKESDNEDIDLGMDGDNEMRADDLKMPDENKNNEDAGVASPVVIDLTGEPENHNYYTWTGITLGGKIRKVYKEVHQWSQPHLTVSGKQKHQNNENSQWLCTYDPPNCGNTFKEAKGLWQHILTHILMNRVECEVDGCGQRYSSKCAVQRHIREHHMVNQFECTKCGRGHQNHGARMRCPCKRQRT